MFTMFDTVTINQLPSFANTSRDAVAGYADGIFVNERQVFTHDPKAHHLSIVVHPTDLGDCLDIENGDADIAEAPGWWHKATMAGIWRPVLYIETSQAGALVAHLAAAAIHRSSYRLWTAHYTDEPHIESGSDATQWTQKALGRNLDESLGLDSFWPHLTAVRQHTAASWDAAHIWTDGGDWKIQGAPRSAPPASAR